MLTFVHYLFRATIAVSQRVQNLLLSIRPENAELQGLVFPSPKGRAINYPNFLSKPLAKRHELDIKMSLCRM